MNEQNLNLLYVYFRFKVHKPYPCLVNTIHKDWRSRKITWLILTLNVIYLLKWFILKTNLVQKGIQRWKINIRKFLDYQFKWHTEDLRIQTSFEFVDWKLTSNARIKVQLFRGFWHVFNMFILDFKIIRTGESLKSCKYCILYQKLACMIINKSRKHESFRKNINNVVCLSFINKSV